MIKKIATVFVIICACVFMLSACNKTEGELDESDNNVGVITIDNLYKNYITNPCVAECESYLNGNLNYYEKYTFGKNALKRFEKQRNSDYESGYKTMVSDIIVKGGTENIYFYDDPYGFGVDKSRITRDNKKFDESAEYLKRLCVGGLLFQGCQDYLVKKGEGIYQVDPDKYTEYGTLAAASYDALGVEYIIENAQTLKIEIKSDGVVVLSHINGSKDKTVITIYNFGKNYIAPAALKERVNEMIKNDDYQIVWELPAE